MRESGLITPEEELPLRRDARVPRPGISSERIRRSWKAGEVAIAQKRRSRRAASIECICTAEGMDAQRDAAHNTSEDSLNSARGKADLARWAVIVSGDKEGDVPGARNLKRKATDCQGQGYQGRNKPFAAVRHRTANTLTILPLLSEKVKRLT